MLIYYSYCLCSKNDVSIYGNHVLSCRVIQITKVPMCHAKHICRQLGANPWTLSFRVVSILFGVRGVALSETRCNLCEASVNALCSVVGSGQCPC
jgi:hypothetical protein